MPRELTEQKIAALKAGLQGHHLDAGQQQVLHSELDALEQRLRAQLPPDAETLEAQLRDWEARMAVQHPVLTSVIAEALQRLSAMGI